MQPAVGIALSLALIHYTMTVIRTGQARVRTGLAAPATQGNEDFERHFRVQQNSLEQLIVFVPSLLVFGEFVNGGWIAFLLGLIFVAGRTLYMLAYVRDPKTRGPGFIIGSAASGTLLAFGLFGALTALFRAS